MWHQVVCKWNTASSLMGYFKDNGSQWSDTAFKNKT